MASTDRDAIRRGYIGPPGAQVHYRTTGTGPTLVLLSPVPRSSSYYRTLMPRLRDSFEVVALDTPGFGLSDELAGPWDMVDVARRMGDALDELGHTSWHVLGVHSGNKIGAALCTLRPQQVERFLFAGMTHSIILDNEARNRAMRAFYRSPDEVVDPAAPPPSSVRLVQRWRAVHHTISTLWCGHDPSTPSVDGNAHRAAVRQHVVDEIMGFESFDRLYAANFSFDLERALRQMPVETIVMEMVVPGEAHLERQAGVLCAAMQRARPLTLTGSDRTLVASQAADFADAIREAIDLSF